MAGTPVRDQVYFYNVNSNGFSVVWEVDTPSTCTVNVYTTINGGGPLSPTINSITHASTVLQNRGVMAVEVSGLSFGTTYYVQTVSNDGQDLHYYPEFGSLLEVKTETQIDTPPQVNGGLLFYVYDPNGIATENLLNDLIIIVDVEGASSPMQADEVSNYYEVDFTTIIRRVGGVSEYWNWSEDTNDHPFTIRIFGGQTPTNGLGQKVIRGTFLKTDVGTYPCIDSGISSCVDLGGGYFINQAILLAGTSVDMELPAGWSMISLPVEPEDARIGTLFPDAGAVFAFSNMYDLLTATDELEVGKGYWIFIGAANTYSIEGMPIENYSLPDSASGWTMIGGCTYPAEASVANGTIRAIFGFSNQYYLVGSNPLEPGKGYWINISELSTITVNMD